MEHSQVRVVRGGVDEARQDGLRDPSQRFLADVGGADLVRGDAQAVAALLGEVDDEPLVGEDLEQVVGGRAREVEVMRDGCRRERLGVAGQQAQDLERVGGCRGVRHGLALIVSGTRHAGVQPHRGGAGPPARQGRVVCRKPSVKRSVRRLTAAQRQSDDSLDAPTTPPAHLSSVLPSTPSQIRDEIELQSVAREPPRWSTHGCVQAAPDHHRRRSPVLRGRRRRRAPRRARRALAPRRCRRSRQTPSRDRRPRRGHHAALRRLHRLRRPRHAPHPDRQAHPAPAQPHPQPRGRQRSRGRQRGRPRADVPAPLHARHRPDRRAARDRDRLRADAQRQPHAGRPRVRLTRLQRRPRARSRTARWR